MRSDTGPFRQERAARAIAEGRFAEQIVPVEVKVRRDTVSFDTDEHPKATTAEKLAGLRPVFQKDGTVTAGNASGINDGAAAVVLARAEAADLFVPCSMAAHGRNQPRRTWPAIYPRA